MKQHLRSCHLLAIAALSLVAATFPVHAQMWPDKPIRLIVAAPPGGISDGVARLLGEQLRINLGQPVVVDNKPGGSAGVAERALMGAAADGYSLLVAPSSIITDIPLSVKKSYDPAKTFTYIGAAAGMVHVLVANNQVPANNVKEVLDYAKRNPNSVNVASLSTGTRSDFLSEMLKDKTGGSIVVSPYKGSAPAITDLLGHHVQLAFEVVTNVNAHIKAGKLKGIAVVSSTRSQYLPNVPTFAEQGLPDFVMPDASVGVFIMSNMPKPLSDRIQQEVARAISSPKYLEALAAQGFDMPKNGSVEQLLMTLNQTTERNRRIIETLKLKLNSD